LSEGGLHSCRSTVSPVMESIFGEGIWCHQCLGMVFSSLILRLHQNSIQRFWREAHENFRPVASVMMAWKSSRWSRLRGCSHRRGDSAAKFAILDISVELMKNWMRLKELWYYFIHSASCDESMGKNGANHAEVVQIGATRLFNLPPRKEGTKW
jgi:hypothetical protein